MLKISNQLLVSKLIVSQLILTIFLVLLLGCKPGQNNNDIDGNTIQLVATGISQPVTLTETLSGNQYQISHDGNHDLSLPDTQTLFELEISLLQNQSCSLDELVLTCAITACPTDYTPVCAKEFFAGAQCITTPCETDRYKTFSNSCSVVSNAWGAFDSACGGLEDQISFHQKPVYLTELALLDLPSSDPFEVITSEISDNTLTINFSVSGGCGSHQFDFYADKIFNAGSPFSVNYLFMHTNHDNCESLVNIERQFDLLPIKEFYQRNYPDVTGNQSVSLGELGNYSFQIN